VTPAALREAFRGRHPAHGDLGFVRDGELYVIGREDDMMSVGGRNVYTSAVEARLGQHHSIRTAVALWWT